MNGLNINIDRSKMKPAMREHVRAKAIKAGSEIVYLSQGNIIIENPATGEKKILKRGSRKIR